MATTSEDVDTGDGKEVVHVRKKPGPPTRIDWDALESAYVDGIEEGGQILYLSTAEVAKRFGVKPGTVGARAANHRWVDKRKLAQSERARQIAEGRNERIRQKAVAFDENALNVAEMGLSLVTVRMGEILQRVSEADQKRKIAEERLKLGLPVDKNDLRSAIWSKEMVELATAAQTFQNIGMRALGTDVNRLEVSGPDGGAIEQTISVTAEIQRDDPDRLAALFKAFSDTGILEELITKGDTIEGEAEVVEEGGDN